MKLKAVKESTIQTKIKNRLKKKGYLVNKIIQCTNNGWPDLEAKKNGVTIHIEVKRPEDPEPDPLQLYRHNQLRKHGFEVIVATNEKDIEHL